MNIYEHNGVVQLVNTDGNGRIRLKKDDSVMILLLRLLYIEKKKIPERKYRSPRHVGGVCEQIRPAQNLAKAKDRQSATGRDLAYVQKIQACEGILAGEA